MRRQKQKAKQTDERQIVEPLTGSSVIVEPTEEETAAAAKQALRKPTWRERWAQAPKKKRNRGVLVGVLILLIGVVVSVVFLVTNQVRIDYAGTYQLAKELKPKMIEIQNAYDCDKVVNYLTSAYATMESYQGYVKGCLEIGEDAKEGLEGLEMTEGVMKDGEVMMKYDELMEKYRKVMNENAKMTDILEAYEVWHEWVIAEGHSGRGEWDWTEEELKGASEILTRSKYELLQEYGKGWLEKKTEALKAHEAYFNKAMDAEGELTELREESKNKEMAFKDWKAENEPQVKELIPLAPAKTGELAGAWQSFYDLVRRSYQENYNREIGGCKELVNQVICE